MGGGGEDRSVNLAYEWLDAVHVMGASVSTTQTTNKASTCGCQTPLMPRSSLSPICPYI